MGQRSVSAHLAIQPEKVLHKLAIPTLPPACNPRSCSENRPMFSADYCFGRAGCGFRGKSPANPR